MDKQIYLVAEGVPFVNGKAVPVDRRVSLTPEEARFDLAHDRVVPAPADADDGEKPRRR